MENSKLAVKNILERPTNPKSPIGIELPDIRSFDDKPLEFSIKPGLVTVLICDDEIMTEGILLSAAGIPHIPEDNIKVQQVNRHYCLYIPSDPKDFLEKYGYSEDLPIGELYYSVAGIYTIEARMREIEESMTSGDFNDEMMDEYGALQSIYERLRGYDKEAWAFEIITRLGLTEDEFTLSTPVKNASSGQKAKILLGMGIFANPTMLILDNVFPHLDTNSKNWLAELLKNTQSGVLMAAYEDETEFLDRVVKTSVFIEYGFGYAIDTSVSAARNTLDQIYAQEAQSAKVFQVGLERREAITAERKNNPKFRRSKNAMQVLMQRQRRSERERERLENMSGYVRIVAIGNPPKEQFFVPSKPSSATPLRIKSPKIMYGKKTGFDMPNLDLEVKRKDRIAILGPNGSGKSTLSRSIYAAFTNPDFQIAAGEIKPGSDVVVGYFSPDMLYEGPIRRERRKVLDYVVDTLGAGESMRNRARAILSYWGFSKDEMEELQVARLGRRAKTQLIMAILMLQEPNLLIIDEPTADLPDDMVERLLSALEGYQGTVITISHEPSFVDAIGPNKILDLNQRKLIEVTEA